MKAEKDVIKGGETGLSSDIAIITAEINTYKRVAGEAIFEIGRRLKHVKENDLAHGEFVNWVKDKLSFSERNAQHYMKVYDRFKGKTKHVSHLPFGTLVILSSFTDEELEQEYELPSGESKKPSEMSRREIEQLKKALKEEQEARKQAEQQAEMARKSEQIAVDKYEELAERESRVNSEVFEELDGVRVVDKDSRKEFYREFAEDLNYIVKKYGSLSYEGQDLRGLAEEESDVGRNIDAFDDFWKALSRSIVGEDQNIIIEMERC